MDHCRIWDPSEQNFLTKCNHVNWILAQFEASELKCLLILRFWSLNFLEIFDLGVKAGSWELKNLLKWGSYQQPGGHEKGAFRALFFGFFFLLKRPSISSRGGHTSKNLVCGCACQTSKFWLSLYLIYSLFATHLFTNFVQKTQNFAKIWCFSPSFAQNTPNLCKLGAFICDENLRSLYQNLRKSVPIGRHTYVYHVNVSQGHPANSTMSYL